MKLSQPSVSQISFGCLLELQGLSQRATCPSKALALLSLRNNRMTQDKNLPLQIVGQMREQLVIRFSDTLLLLTGRAHSNRLTKISRSCLKMAYFPSDLTSRYRQRIHKKKTGTHLTFSNSSAEWPIEHTWKVLSDRFCITTEQFNLIFFIPAVSNKCLDQYKLGGRQDTVVLWSLKDNLFFSYLCCWKENSGDDDYTGDCPDFIWFCGKSEFQIPSTAETRTHRITFSLIPESICIHTDVLNLFSCILLHF